MSAPSFSLPGLGMTIQTPADPIEPSENDDGYILKELDSHLPKFKEISIDLKNAGLKVLKIEQLDNHLMWQKYIAEKKAVDTRKPQDPKFEMNEKYLYHGTSAKKDYICMEGLDARLSKKGGCFGQGIYFSDNPLKCVKYAEKKETTSFIVLARVILGCSKIYRKSEKDRLLIREPEKKGHFKGWRFHDSVEGCPKDYKEFVIYRNDRALIDCLVSYTKDPNNTSSVVSGATSSGTSISSSGLLLTSAKSMKNYDDTDSDTTDEDEKSDSSDSDSPDEEKGLGNKNDDKGNSSDSSVEQENDYRNRRQSTETSYKTSTTNAQSHTNREKRGDEILADKKKEFMRQTGENRQHIIESYLSTTALDVDKAVELFLNKEKKRRDMELEEMRREKEKEKLANKETDVDEGAACGVSVINPLVEPQKWNQLESKDKEAIVDALMDNFLMIVGLDDNSDNRTLGRKLLSSCNYDLDSSILTYYESLQFA